MAAAESWRAGGGWRKPAGYHRKMAARRKWRHKWRKAKAKTHGGAAASLAMAGGVNLAKAAVKYQRGWLGNGVA
jgi:hypothetical protein